MTHPQSYLKLWEDIRERVERMLSEEIERDDLDEITKLLERVQKGELSVRDAQDGGALVVNIHIPGVCEASAPSPPLPSDGRGLKS
jgi:hypothetical protein